MMIANNDDKTDHFTSRVILQCMCGLYGEGTYIPYDIGNLHTLGVLRGWCASQVYVTMKYVLAQLLDNENIN